MPKLSLPFLIVCLAVSALYLTGCDSSDPDDPMDNADPIASIGVAETVVPVGTQVTFDASGSSDPEGSPLTFSWSLSTPDGSAAQLSDDTAVSPTFTPDVAGDYTATVTVSDGDGGTNSVAATVTAESANVVIVDSDITTNTVWTSGTTYRVTVPINLDGATLTIQPDVRVEFEQDAGLFVRSGASNLLANGTAVDPIVMTGTTEIAGHWRGLGFERNSNTHELEYVEISYGGQPGVTYSNIEEAAQVALDRDVNVEITNSTIRNSATFGLYTDFDAGLPGFAENTFSGNAAASAYLPSTLMTALDSGSTFDDSDPATPSVVRIYETGTFGSATTIAALDVAYRIDDNDVLRASDEFTISAGTEIEFGEASGLYMTSTGTLAIDGQSGNPVRLTGTEQTAGYWKGIGFDSSPVRHVIRFTVIEYGGNADPHSGLDQSANIAIEENVLELRNSTVRNSGSFGLYIETEGSTLPDFAANFFSQNAEAPMLILPSQMIAIDSASDFTNNTARYILVDDGSTSVNGTVSPLAGDVPYRIDSADVLRFGGELTLADGVEIEFEEAAGFFLTSSSKLIAAGTSADGVLLTSAADTPAQGDWKGIVFDSNPLAHELTEFTIEYAGGGEMSGVNGPGNLRMDANSNLTLTNCTIRQSAGFGIWRDADNSVVNETGTNYSNNANGPQNTP